MPDDHLAYFSGLAETYSRYRPSYPPDAVRAIAHGLEPPVIAADVGCGTGISTRLLAEAVAEVVGIEPNDDMRRQAAEAARSLAGVSFRSGTAEHTGLADGSVRLVLCAQSFHWFDAPAALREFHRILEPAGRLALMWNVRDDRDPFTAAYGRINRRGQDHTERSGRILGLNRTADPTIGGHFAEVRRVVFPNPQRLDLDGLIGRARSASYFPRENTELAGDMEHALRDVFDRFQTEGFVTMRQRTEVTLARRSDA